MPEAAVTANLELEIQASPLLPPLPSESTSNYTALRTAYLAAKSQDVEAFQSTVANWQDLNLAQRVIERAALTLFVTGDFDNGFEVLRSFGLPDMAVESTLEKALRRQIADGNAIHALEMTGRHPKCLELISSTQVLRAASDRLRLLYSIPRDQLGSERGCELSLLNLFYGARHLNTETFPTEPFTEEDKAMLIRAFGDFRTGVAVSIGDRHGLRGTPFSPELESAFFSGILNSLSNRIPFPLGNRLLEWEGSYVDELSNAHFPEHFVGAMLALEIKSVTGLVSFACSEPEYVAWIINHPEQLFLTSCDKQSIETLKVSALEGFLLKKEGFDLSGFGAPPNFREVAFALRKVTSEWQDEANVWEPFCRGMNVFGTNEGATVLFELMHKSKGSRHDFLSSIDRVYALASSDGYSSPNNFRLNILNQVLTDKTKDHCHPTDTKRIYANSVGLLLTIAKEMNADVSGTIALLRASTNLPPGADQMVSRLDSPLKIFSSWPNLIKFFELECSARHQSFSELLEGLKAGNNSEAIHYLSVLAAARRIPVGVIRELYLNPGAFWALGDDNDSLKIHTRIKPSNFFEEEHVKLEPQHVLQALIGGKLDAVAAFPAREIEYFVRRGEDSPVTLTGALTLALGSRKEGVKGLAKNAGQLFSKVTRLLRVHNVDLATYLSNSTAMPPEVNDEISALVLDPEIGLPQSQLTALRASLFRKGDPLGIAVNSLFPFCMPPGTGKFNEYHMFPECGLFAIYGEGETGHVAYASSVVTRNVDVGSAFLPLVGDTRSNAQHFETLLPDSVRKDHLFKLTCDNVELNDNRRDDGSRKLITAVYADFFARYLKDYSKSLRLEPHSLFVGHSHEDSEVLVNASNWVNHTIPTAYLGYSDAWEENGRKLDFSITDATLLRRVVTSEKLAFSVVPKGIGVEDVRTCDVLSMAKIENDFYSGSADLKQGLIGIQNTVYSARYSNVLRGYPELSLVNRSISGEMDGYLLAYVGKFGRDVMTRADLPKPEDAVVYIDDLVSLPGSFAAPLLLREFVNRYITHFATKETFLPLFMQLRGSTTFKHLDFFERRLNRELERFAFPPLRAAIVHRENVDNEELVHVLFRPSTTLK